MKYVSRFVAIGSAAIGALLVSPRHLFGVSLDALYTNPLEQWTAETLVKFGILAFVSVACNFVFCVVIIDLYSKKSPLNKIYLHQVMTPKPLLLEKSATLADVVELFDKNKIKTVPIIDGVRILRGIITRKDIERFRAMYSDEYYLTHKHALLSQNPVTKIMVGEVVTLYPHDSLEKAVDLMSQKEIGCIPVIDEQGRVQGMVTHKNILAAAKKFLM